MKNLKVNGAVVLFIGGLLGKFIGAIYRIPLSNLLGPEGVGLYQMAFPIYSFLLTILTGGVSTLLSKKIAGFRAKNNYAEISKSYKMARNISLLYGLIFCFVLIVLSFPFSLLQGNTNAVWGYMALSVGFVFASLLGAYRGYFQGYENMTPTAVSQILEQVFKLIFGLIGAWVLYRFGLVWGVFGSLLGISISEIISFIYLKIKMGNLQRVKISVIDYKDFIKQVMPVGMSYAILPFSALIDSFLIVNLLTFSGFTTSFSTALYGIESGMILPLINMPNILISAISISLIPTMSYKKEVGENYSKNIFNIFKFVYILILPCCVGLFILSEQILSIIYTTLNIELLSIASSLLKISVFEMFFLSFITITNAILQGVGKEKQPFYSLLTGVIIKVGLGVILISNSAFNIYGLPLSSAIAYFIAASINILVIKQESRFRFKLLDILFPIIASLFMCTFIIFILGVIDNFNLISLAFVILISAGIYFALLMIFKHIKIEDFKNLLQKESK